MGIFCEWANEIKAQKFVPQQLISAPSYQIINTNYDNEFQNYSKWELDVGCVND